MGNNSSTIHTDNTNPRCDHTFMFRWEDFGTVKSKTDSCIKCQEDRVVYATDLQKSLNLKNNERLHIHTWDDEGKCVGSMTCDKKYTDTIPNYEIIKR